MGFVAEGFDVSSYYRRAPDGFDESMSWMFEGISTDGDGKLGDFGPSVTAWRVWSSTSTQPNLGTPPETLIATASEDHTDIYLEVLEELYFNVPGASGSQNPRVRGDVVYFPTQNGGAVWSAQLHRLSAVPSHTTTTTTTSRG